jgi:hypothetical protein
MADMPSELEELVGFLHSPQAAIAQVALDHLVGYLVGAHQLVFAYNDYAALADLKALAQSKGHTTANQATTILANLCDDPTMRRLIVEDREFVQALVAKIVDPTNPNADIMCILLANLAKSDEINVVLECEVLAAPAPAGEAAAPGAAAPAGAAAPTGAAPAAPAAAPSSRAIDRLLDCFVKGANRTLNPKAEYDYLAYFFADILRFRQGRDYFVTEQPYDGVVPLSKLLVFTEFYQSKIRRQGVASTIKNALFDTNRHWHLVSDPRINLLPYILLPLAGPEELDDDDMFNLPEELQLLGPDKRREPQPDIICTHLESLLLLCTTRRLRHELRAKAVYPLIKILHTAVELEEVADLCDRLVQMLMRDEADDAEDADDADDDSDDDQIVEVA